MSDKIWQSQLEINGIFDKRIDMANEQVTALTELVIAQGKLLAQLSALVAPAEKCGKHCGCKDQN